MLQKATVTFTRENGERVTRILTVKSVVFHYERGTIETIYTAYPSDEAKERGARAEYFSQTVPMDLNSESDMALLLSVSARLWDINRQLPFIADWSDTGEDGKIKATLKSLDDLEAAIEEAKI